MSKTHSKTILSLGADIKSRFCIKKNSSFIVSREFGNLAEKDNFNLFRKSVLRKRFKFDIIAYDLHPAYFSSLLSRTLPATKKIGIQHHHAHIAAQLLFAKIKKPVIGVAFDGTGYGLDGNIWGGEFMLVGAREFKRIAQFKYLPMPSGEAVVKEPWRMALSLVYAYLGDKTIKRNFEFLKYCKRQDKQILIKMIKSRINSPLTSSVGRLFDAVSSILGVCHKVNYEAEAAVKLEELAQKSRINSCYQWEILHENNEFVIGHRKMLEAMLKDIKNKVPKPDIAKKFHNSLSAVTLLMLDKIRQDYQINNVVLSGGVFANKLLFNSLKDRLINCGYNLILNKQVPVNDFGICLGQTYIALNSK